MLAVSCKTTVQYRSCRRAAALMCEAFLHTFTAYLCAVYDMDTFIISSFSVRDMEFHLLSSLPSLIPDFIKPTFIALESCAAFPH